MNQLRAGDSRAALVARALREQGLIVIGNHAPEFGFEKSRDNVEKAIAKLGIAYPVVMDNRFANWNAYGNRYWPTKYLIDKKGIVRFKTIGEGATRAPRR